MLQHVMHTLLHALIDQTYTLINFSIFPIKISLKLFSKKKKKVQPSWQVRAVVGVTGKACPWVGSSPLGFGYENMVHKANSTKAPTEDD